MASLNYLTKEVNMKTLALDIGGTNIRSAIVQGAKLKDYQKVKTPKKKAGVIKKLFDVVGEYGKVDAICVSTAGFERNGRIVNSLNNDMDGTALTKILKARFGKKVYVE
ncbi:MAG: hypothetical protein ABIH92_02055, partial [Nanoarchaeota archaeon]